MSQLALAPRLAPHVDDVLVYCVVSLSVTITPVTGTPPLLCTVIVFDADIDWIATLLKSSAAPAVTSRLPGTWLFPDSATNGIPPGSASTCSTALSGPGAPALYFTCTTQVLPAPSICPAQSLLSPVGTRMNESMLVPPTETAIAPAGSSPLLVTTNCAGKLSVSVCTSWKSCVASLIDNIATFGGASGGGVTGASIGGEMFSGYGRLHAAADAIPSTTTQRTSERISEPPHHDEREP